MCDTCCECHRIMARVDKQREEGNMSNAEDGIVTGNCEIESCNEKATSYDCMDNKLCDEHWEEVRQQELEEDHNAE